MLKRVQNLPESRRKIILWVLMALVFAVLAILFVKNFQKNNRNFDGEKVRQGINFPNLQEELNKLKKIEE